MLPTLAGPAVQLAAGTSVAATVSQVVLVYEFPEPAALGVQVCTATFDVVGLAQVVATQVLPASAGTDVHEATPVGPVTVGAGHVMAVH